MAHRHLETVDIQYHFNKAWCGCDTARSLNFMRKLFSHFKFSYWERKVCLYEKSEIILSYERSSQINQTRFKSGYNLSRILSGICAITTVKMIRKKTLVSSTNCFITIVLSVVFFRKWNFDSQKLLILLITWDAHCNVQKLLKTTWIRSEFLCFDMRNRRENLFDLRLKTRAITNHKAIIANRQSNTFFAACDTTMMIIIIPQLLRKNCNKIVWRFKESMEIFVKAQLSTYANLFYLELIQTTLVRKTCWIVVLFHSSNISV